MNVRNVNNKKLGNELKQTCFVNQDILENMTYDAIGIVRIVDEKKDALVRKFNRRIVRNYILSAVFGGLVVAGVMKAPKVIGEVRDFVAQKMTEQSKSR